MKKNSTPNVFAEIAEAVNSRCKRPVCHVFGEEGGLMGDVSYWLPTGCSSLDALIGEGLPGKRIIEIFGPEGGGKSTMLMTIIASARAHGFYPIIFEPEGSNLGRRMELLGIPKNELFALDAETIEDFFEQLSTTIEEIKRHDKKARILVGWDSLAATLTEAQMKGDYDDIQVASVARVVSNGIRKLNAAITKNDVIFVVVNQIREKIGTFWGGEKEVTPGGRALKFYACIRLRLKVVEKIKDKDENVTGVKVEVYTAKNKVTSPFKTCMVVIDFERGVLDLESLAATMKDLCSDGFEYNDKVYRGEETVRKLFAKDPAAIKAAIAIVKRGNKKGRSKKDDE